jgi:hypothetical protein
MPVGGDDDIDAWRDEMRLIFDQHDYHGWRRLMAWLSTGLFEEGSTTWLTNSTS